jgi:hypothetical protein
MMASREAMWYWARTRPWRTILIEAALLLLFVLTTTRLVRP